MLKTVRDTNSKVRMIITLLAGSAVLTAAMAHAAPISTGADQSVEMASPINPVDPERLRGRLGPLLPVGVTLKSAEVGTDGRIYIVFNSVFSENISKLTRNVEASADFASPTLVSLEQPERGETTGKMSMSFKSMRQAGTAENKSNPIPADDGGYDACRIDEMLWWRGAVTRLLPAGITSEEFGYQSLEYKAIVSGVAHSAEQVSEFLRLVSNSADFKEPDLRFLVKKTDGDSVSYEFSLGFVLRNPKPTDSSNCRTLRKDGTNKAAS